MSIDQPLGGHYQIIKKLGEGGFGETFLAKDLHLPDKPLRVIKKLITQFRNPEEVKIAKRLFDKEAEALYKLGDHNQIPQLFAHFEENNEFYLVQEYIEGSDLRSEIQSGKKLSEIEVIKLLQEILEVLSFVHDNGVIHRDLKPENLMRRTSDSKIIMIDFGAVKQISSIIKNTQGKTIQGTVIHTPGYAPSEQREGKPKLCSDIYAVGMLGIFALTGMPPYELPKDSKKEVVWEDKVSVSPKSTKIINKMVCHNFNERYQSATEVLNNLLSDVLSTNNDSSLPSTLIPNYENTNLGHRRNPIKYLVIALVFLVAIPGLIFLNYSLQLLPNIFISKSNITDKLTKKQIEEIARAITVRILLNNSAGSGVIINRQGQVYTVITNKHVLLDDSDKYKILTSDGKVHNAHTVESEKFKDLDLALIQFTSSQSYQVAESGDLEQLSVGDTVYATGFSNWQLSDKNKLENTNEKGLEVFQFTTGKVAMLPEKMLLEGYQIGYTNDVVAGMSGGAVLNNSGKLVGINGRLQNPLAEINSFKFTDETVPSSINFQKMKLLNWGILIDQINSQ